MGEFGQNAAAFEGSRLRCAIFCVKVNWWRTLRVVNPPGKARPPGGGFQTREQGRLFPGDENYLRWVGFASLANRRRAVVWSFRILESS